MKSFTDKVVVITGAGSGIGRALAIRFAGEGAKLALSDVNEEGLDETVVRAEKAGASEVKRDRLDVADRAAFEAYAADVAGHFGRVNIVINNAGVSLAGDLIDLDWDDIDWILGINWGGVLHGTKFFLPHLIASGDAHVVNISSLFGLISMPSQTMYNASKYAVRGMTEALREEMLMAGHNVGVTAVHPGGIKTNIVRGGRVGADTDLNELSAFFDKKLARTSADQAAATIIKGIQRKQPRVLVGADAHVIHQFGRLVGARYQDVFAAGAKRMMPQRR